MSRVTRRLVVRGLVQGVGYRESMCRAADALGVAGWVRNRRDGTVEAVVCGTAADVERMLDWARHGPRSARVERLEVEDCDGEYLVFERRPSV